MESLNCIFLFYCSKNTAISIIFTRVNFVTVSYWNKVFIFFLQVLVALRPSLFENLTTQLQPCDVRIQHVFGCYKSSEERSKKIARTQYAHDASYYYTLFCFLRERQQCLRITILLPLYTHSISFCASLVTNRLGVLNFLLIWQVTICLRLEFVNGMQSANITYSTTPKAHTSDAFGLYGMPLKRKTRGACESCSNIYVPLW